LPIEANDVSPRIDGADRVEIRTSGAPQPICKGVLEAAEDWRFFGLVTGRLVPLERSSFNANASADKSKQIVIRDLSTQLVDFSERNVAEIVEVL
jgi:hypothetical protein